MFFADMKVWSVWTVKINSNFNFQGQSHILNHPLKPFGHVKKQNHDTCTVFNHSKVYYLCGMLTTERYKLAYSFSMPTHPSTCNSSKSHIALLWNLILGGGIWFKSDNSNQHIVYTCVPFYAFIACHKIFIGGNIVFQR